MEYPTIILRLLQSYSVANGKNGVIVGILSARCYVKKVNEEDVTVAMVKIMYHKETTSFLTITSNISNMYVIVPSNSIYQKHS